MPGLSRQLSPFLLLQENMPFTSSCATCHRLTWNAWCLFPLSRGEHRHRRAHVGNPSCSPLFKRLTLCIGWILRLQSCGQVVVNCWALMLRLALCNVHKITKWKYKSPRPRSSHNGMVWSTFFTKRKSLGDLRERISLVNESWDFGAWLSYRWWMNSFFPQSRNQDGLRHTTSLENHMEVLVTSTLIPDELIRINVSGSNTSGYHND